MLNYILVVVDMQSDFLVGFTDDSVPNKTAVINNCKKAITKAMKNNNPIIFLEFEYFGKTIKELRDLVKGYKLKYTKIKEARDGSFKIKSVIDEFGLSPKYLKITGIWSDQCVVSTVMGLRNFYPDSHISIISSAIGAQTETQQKWGLEQMRNYGAKISRRLP